MVGGDLQGRLFRQHAEACHESFLRKNRKALSSGPRDIESYDLNEGPRLHVCWYTPDGPDLNDGLSNVEAYERATQVHFLESDNVQVGDCLLLWRLVGNHAVGKRGIEWMRVEAVEHQAIEVPLGDDYPYTKVAFQFDTADAHLRPLLQRALPFSLDADVKRAVHNVISEDKDVRNFLVPRDGEDWSLGAADEGLAIFIDRLKKEVKRLRSSPQ